MNENRKGISKGIDTTIVWLYIALVVIGWIAIFSVEYRPGDNVMSKIIGFEKIIQNNYFLSGSVLLQVFLFCLPTVNFLLRLQTLDMLLV